VIAPSLLYRPEIIIMDEATVSFNTGTNAKIQRIMRTDFKDSTFITMTHHINTIFDNDNILVMDDGQAVEFDDPIRGILVRDLVDANNT
jgi:ABC-type multidrug transport system fused ATPase/permease subunit